MNQQILQMLRQFGRDGRSGIFTCESVDDQATRFLMLKDGRIVGARSSLSTERLGEYLVREGIISKRHLEDGSLFARRGKRLGEVLAELDIIDEEEIPYYVSQQALDIACKAILSADSGAEFSARKDVAQVLPEPLPVFEVMMEVSRRASTVEGLVSGLRSDPRRLELSEDFETFMQHVRLRAYEAFVLQRIRSGSSVASMFEDTPVSPEETARAIIGYLSSGFVEFADQADTVETSDESDESYVTSDEAHETDDSHETDEASDDSHEAGAASDDSLEAGEASDDSLEADESHDAPSIDDESGNAPEADDAEVDAPEADEAEVDAPSVAAS